jgi:hypothetical protein
MGRERGEPTDVRVRPAEFEHGNGADSGGLPRVACEAGVAPRLLGVDGVALGAGQFPYGHLVRLGSAFDTAVAGGAVPIGRRAAEAVRS